MNTLATPKIKNLSESMLTNGLTMRETSTIANEARLSGASCNPCLKVSARSWYRDLTRLRWNDRFLNPIEQQQVLARIAVTEADRTDPQLLDTIIGYRRGNWIFEWIQEATYWKGYNPGEPSPNYALKAMSCYGIAGYPHLRGDLLANMAQYQAYKYYFEAAACLDLNVTELVLHVSGKQLKGLLHLPNSGSPPYPTILVIGSLTAFQTDYMGFYLSYLQNQGFAMCVFDLPGIGFSSHIPLTEDTDNLHQKIIQELSLVPQLDYRKLFLLGIRFGANLALRLGYLMPAKIAGILLMDGILHHSLQEPSGYLERVPMLLDSFASAFHAEQDNWFRLQTRIRGCSLQLQGFLRKSLKPSLFMICLEGDLNRSLEDADLLTVSNKINYLRVPIKRRQAHLHAAVMHAMEWLKSIK